MKENFDQFMSQLKETHFSLKDFVDFHKVATNVESIAIRLNQLNYLIGQDNMADAVKRLWKENSKVFSVLDILLAVRAKSRKKAIDANGNVQLIREYFKSPDQVLVFLNETGLAEVFKTKQIKNLVDYVFGVEVGLDSNARKNRSGHIMEALVANALSENGIQFEREVYYTQFPEVVKALGLDIKRFDFVISKPDKTYLVETNFYAGSGSKLNEIARSYTELAPKINAIPGFEFVWITDGKGWVSASNNLKEAFAHIPSIYNLTNLSSFIDLLK